MRAYSIIEATQDAKLFGPWFKDRDTWAAWMTFLCALFGLPMTPDQAAIYHQCTGRVTPPTDLVAEAWLICGRRAGKSFMLALVAVFLACFRDYKPYLAPGERGTIMVLATDRKQARTIVRYIRGMLKGDLTNRVTIEVATASFRKTRGYTLVAALCDEIAFWLSEGSAEPDFEILDALRPGMATIPNAMLLCASSPYAKRGALHDAYARHYGKDVPGLLVWKAPTRTMNPSVPQSLIDRALERDRAWATAEYLAEFRDDIAAFMSREAIMDCIKAGVRERLPNRSQRYVAFVDPSGGLSLIHI